MARTRRKNSKYYFFLNLENVTISRNILLFSPGISSFGYLMTSLKMASWLNKQESIFTPSLRPWRLSPLNLSHETKRDGKVTTEEHVERNKDGFLRF